MAQRNTTSAQLDAIFAELTGAQDGAAARGAKRTRGDRDAEAARALAANEDRLDELVLRVRGGGAQPLRRSRWDVLLARFEQRKCFELVFGAHFDWLNRHRPELVFCIVRELLRRSAAAPQRARQLSPLPPRRRAKRRRRAHAERRTRTLVCRLAVLDSTSIT